MLSVPFPFPALFDLQSSRPAAVGPVSPRPAHSGTAVRRQTKSGWRVPPFILASLFQHVKNREFLTELTIVNGRNTLF
jgi:hypothetical protein